MGEMTKLTVSNSKMDCYVAHPDGEPRAGVLVCMHGPGVDAFIRDICKRLAGEGYLAIAPNFYHRLDESEQEPWLKIDDGEAIDDMKAATDYLEAQGMTSCGVVGFCMGGRLAFLDLAHDARFGTGVIFHGGNIMASRGSLPSPLQQAGAIKASVLGIFGSDDTNPSPADRDTIEQRLIALGVPHRFESFDGAGHAFLNFVRPHMYREEQAGKAWALCTTWLRDKL